ncbi:MAG: YgaP family membrane protein, partial [Halothiobacillaceae bacterium]
MPKNVGLIDRVIRALVGLALIGLAAAGVIGWWGYIGAVPLLTAVISF